jgi:hypothetical protein
MNLFVEPELKTPFPNTPAVWTCPVTGLRVPKTLIENLRYREKLLKAAEHDRGMQADILYACQMSPLYWINTFAWTYKQWDVNPLTGKSTAAKMNHVPMITWEIQDDFSAEFHKAVKEAYDLLVGKSRDMGASWMCVLGFHHIWLFDPEAQLLEMSRTREYVDQTGNMKALFQKHDYINQWLPDWMRPPLCLPGEKYRSKMHMKNILIGSCLDGESTTEHAGSGDRRKAILLDEFAKVEYGQQIRSATGDISPCRIVNSTPVGAHTEYSKWKNGGQVKVFVLPFWEHPEKGTGRYVKRDAITNQFQIRSPWYDYEDSRRTRREMAQEVDMNDLEAGSTFFNAQTIEQHKALFGRLPRERLSIALADTISDKMVETVVRRRNIQADVRVHPSRAEDALDIYVPLVNGRPDQQFTYTFGIDISRGQGASNSTIAIGCDQTKQKIAELATANQPPHEFARTIVAMALWCGGRSPRNLPKLIWEKNGPGWDVGRLLVKIYHYPFYYRNQKVGTYSEGDTDKYGWQNNDGNNQIVMGNYLRLFETGEFNDPSIKCLEEMKSYIIYPNNTIGPADLVEESESAKQTHGDRVRATSLMLLGFEQSPRMKTETATPPPGSVGDRMRKVLTMKKKKRSAQTFDFTR